MSKVLKAGIDIGSTTVKLVILNNKNKIIFGEYRRHCSYTQKTLCTLLKEAKEQLGGDIQLDVQITGSGGMGLAKALNINFVQEVVATSKALKFVAPKTDVAIELGGEDAKII